MSVPIYIEVVLQRYSQRRWNGAIKYILASLAGALIGSLVVCLIAGLVFKYPVERNVFIINCTLHFMIMFTLITNRIR